jgi:hypothetical protein
MDRITIFLYFVNIEDPETKEYKIVHKVVPETLDHTHTHCSCSYQCKPTSEEAGPSYLLNTATKVIIN